MLVIAQGIATTVAPYLHLGYLAAYSDPMPPGFEYVHIPLVVGLGLGAAVVYKGLQAALRGQKPRGLVLTAVVCLVCLAMAWTLWTGPGPPPEEITRTRATHILALLNLQQRPQTTDSPFTSLRDKDVNLPEYHGRRAGLAPSSPVPQQGKVYTDYWGLDFQVKSRVVSRMVTQHGSDSSTETYSEKIYEYWLISAGPDGQLGTADDIVIDPARLK